MPLDDREQQILQEIERRFYEEDPSLAQTVGGRGGMRLPVFGAVVGLVMLALFTVNAILGAIGFVILVVSGTAIVHALSLRGGLLGDLGRLSGRNFQTPPGGKRRE